MKAGLPWEEKDPDDAHAHLKRLSSLVCFKDPEIKKERQLRIDACKKTFFSHWLSSELGQTKYEYKTLISSVGVNTLAVANSPQIPNDHNNLIFQNSFGTIIVAYQPTDKHFRDNLSSC